jgi:hypothetical protein
MALAPINIKSLTIIKKKLLNCLEHAFLNSNHTCLQNLIKSKTLNLTRYIATRTSPTWLLAKRRKTPRAEVQTWTTQTKQTLWPTCQSHTVDIFSLYFPASSIPAFCFPIEDAWTIGGKENLNKEGKLLQHEEGDRNPRKENNWHNNL